MLFTLEPIVKHVVESHWLPNLFLFPVLRFPYKMECRLVVQWPSVHLFPSFGVQDSNPGTSRSRFGLQ